MKIQIALESYDDLFSDFDIRGYNERPFSRDFLDELNLRMIKTETADDTEVVLLVPQEVRNTENETVILNRLNKFFSDRYAYYVKKNRKTVIQSLLFIFTGLVLMFIANFFTQMIPPAFSDFLLIPSWYFVWSGLEQFVESRTGIKEKIHYYGILIKVSLGFATR